MVAPSLPGVWLVHGCPAVLVVLVFSGHGVGTLLCMDFGLEFTALLDQLGGTRTSSLAVTVGMVFSVAEFQWYLTRLGARNVAIGVLNVRYGSPENPGTARAGFIRAKFLLAPRCN